MLTEYEKQQFLSSILVQQDFWGKPFNPSDKTSSPTKFTSCVYALKMSDSTVKIGATSNLEQRIKSIKTATGLDVLAVHRTEFAPRDVIFHIESLCHATFENHRARGEYFNITFEEACNELDSHADEISMFIKRKAEKGKELRAYYEEIKEQYLKPVQQEVQEESCNNVSDFERCTALIEVALVAPDIEMKDAILERTLQLMKSICPHAVSLD